tara:strand:+ start:193 stop:405 length:213 start_codon:yes stop_codon:yes gene_type:complete
MYAEHAQLASFKKRLKRLNTNANFVLLEKTSIPKQWHAVIVKVDNIKNRTIRNQQVVQTASPVNILLNAV